MNVPIRLIAITVSKGWSVWAPRLPAVFSAQPIPAQQTLMRSPPGSAAAAATAASTVSGSVTLASDEAGALAELGGQRRALLLVEVGDRDVGAVRVQAAHGGLTEPRRPAGDERRASLDPHGREP